MPDKKSKTEKIDAGIDKGKKVAGVVKEFTPPAVDGIIEQGEQMVDTGWGLAKLVGGLIDGIRRKKNKVQ